MNDLHCELISNITVKHFTIRTKRAFGGPKIRRAFSFLIRPLTLRAAHYISKLSGTLRIALAPVCSPEPAASNQVRVNQTKSNQIQPDRASFVRTATDFLSVSPAHQSEAKTGIRNTMAQPSAGKKVPLIHNFAESRRREILLTHSAAGLFSPALFFRFA